MVQLPRRGTREPFHALLEAIAHQQLAGAAAKAIWSRVLALFPEGRPNPDHLIALSDAHLRGAGLSRSKALSMKAIAAQALAGEVPDAKRIAGMSEARNRRSADQDPRSGPLDGRHAVDIHATPARRHAAQRLWRAQGISSPLSQAQAAHAQTVIDECGVLASLSDHGGFIPLANRRRAEGKQSHFLNNSASEALTRSSSA